MVLLKKIVSYLLLATVILSLSYYGYDSHAKVLKLEGEIASVKEQEDQDKALGQYVLNMMYKTRAATRESDAQKQVLARDLVQVTNDVFATVEHKKAFIAVTAIESEFHRYAQSPTGPKGLTQVAKAAFKEGLENCGIDTKTIKEEDVWDTKLNLYAGACYFRALMEQNNNDPYIAIVAYNQGPNSKDIKTYAKSGYLEGTEALKYVARFNFLKRTVSDIKAPNVPAIESSVKPSLKVEDNKATSKK